MKKILAVVLLLSCVLTMGFAALAEDLGEHSKDVTGTYAVNQNDEAAVYSLDISWPDLDFSYTDGYKKWNPETHKYDSVDGTWEDKTAEITVTNHSNAAIEVTPKWTADEGFESAIMKFYNGESEIRALEIDSAAPVGNAETGEAKVGTISVKPSGSLSSAANGGKIGSVTLTISAASSVQSVATQTELMEALIAGGEYKLGNDIALDQYGVAVQTGKEVVLDLNGYELTSEEASAVISVSQNASLTVKDSKGTGKIDGSVVGIYNYGTLTVESGSIYGGNKAISGSGSLVISGGEILSGIDDSASSVNITGGTFSFDPSEYPGWIATGYKAVDNGDGTYTVAAQ